MVAYTIMASVRFVCVFARVECCCSKESEGKVCPSLQCSRAAWHISLNPGRRGAVSITALDCQLRWTPNRSTFLFLLRQLMSSHILQRDRTETGMVLTVAPSLMRVSLWTDTICFTLQDALLKSINMS